MKRITFDSHIVDAIGATPGLLSAIQRAYRAGALELVTTHIQSDELAEITDPDKRARLLAIYNALPTSWVPTDGFVLGYSRLDMARLGGGEWTGVSIDDLDSPHRKHRRDALIGTTAAGEADVLVTNDRRLARRMRGASAPCEIWGFDQFRRFVESVA